MLKVMSKNEVEKAEKQVNEYLYNLPLDFKWAIENFIKRILIKKDKQDSIQSFVKLRTELLKVVPTD